MGPLPQTEPTPADGAGPAGESVLPGTSTAPDGSDQDGAARRLTRRRTTAIALLVVAIAVATIVVVSGGHGRGGAPAAGVPAGDTTTTVARRTLTESSTVDGTLGYGTTLELYDRLAGTFTWLPAVGATIVRGGTLFRLNNLPVVLMYGVVPAFRTLKEGVSAGPDVAQLNRNLIDLGYDPDGEIADVEDFSTATAAAVRRWQKAEGLSENGTVELGRVVFAPGARRVTTVHVALGQDPPAAQPLPSGSDEPAPRPGGNETGSAPAAGKAPGRKPKSKGRNPASAKTRPKHNKTPKKADKSAAKKPSEAKTNDGGGDPPSKGGADNPSKAPEDATAGAGEVVLSTTSPKQLVQLKLKAEQQQLAHVGERAPVLLPGGGTVEATITEVGTVASEAKGAEDEKGGATGEGGTESTIPVTLALERRVAHLDEAPVSVELVKSVRRDVLAVPATALTATAGGGYAIEVLQGTRRVGELSVTPGMFANGYVQVEGPGLHEGLTVIEAE